MTETVEPSRADDFVTSLEIDEAVVEMLSGVPLPEGFDPTGLGELSGGPRLPLSGGSISRW